MVAKRRQIASFDPFLRDAAGNPIGNRDPSQFFISGGGGSQPPKRIPADAARKERELREAKARRNRGYAFTSFPDTNTGRRRS